MIGAASLVPRLSKHVGRHTVLGAALLLVVMRAVLAALIALGVVAALGLAVWILGLRAQVGEQHVEPWGSRSPNRASR